MKPRNVHKLGTDELDIEVLQLRRKLFEMREPEGDRKNSGHFAVQANQEGYCPSAHREADACRG